MDFERYKKINDDKVNFGEMPGATVAWKYRNLGCGDGYVIFLKVESGVIQDASYTTTGCGFGLVSLAVVTQLVKGKTLEEAAKIRPEDIDREFTFPEKRKNYPQVAWEAMQQAIQAAQGQAPAVS